MQGLSFSLVKCIPKGLVFPADFLKRFVSDLRLLTMGLRSGSLEAPPPTNTIIKQFRRENLKGHPFGAQAGVGPFLAKERLLILRSRNPGPNPGSVSVPYHCRTGTGPFQGGPPSRLLPYHWQT